MILHEAIKNVLLNFGKLTTQEIAEKINWHHLYKRKDGQPISANQISARISKYPELFSIDKDNKIVLKNYSLISLKLTIDKIAESIYNSNYNSDHLSELLLPLFAIYLRFKEPITLLRDKNGNTKSDKLISNLVDDLNDLNASDQFKGLLTIPIELFSSLNSVLQSNIIIKILEGSIQLRKAQYFTERKTIHEYDSPEKYLTEDVNMEALLESTKTYSKRYEEYATWNISEDDFKVYFTKLINEYNWKKKALAEGSSPTVITKLISSIIQTEEFELDSDCHIFDPFLGKGSLLANIILENKNRNVMAYGGDINENAVIVAKLLFAVNRIDQYNLRKADAFNDWLEYQNMADWFVTDPPLGLKLTSHHEIFPGYGNPKNFMESVINMALYHTHEEGKACIIVPESFLFSAAKSMILLRKKLIDKNYLDGIISLPSGMYAPYSSVKTSVIILDKSRIRKRNKLVFVYDASKIKPEEFATLIPEIQSRYLEKDNEFGPIENFTKVSNIVGSNYEYKIKDPISILLSGSPELNYIPIQNLLPVFVDGSNRRQPIVFAGNSIKKEDLLTTEGIPYIQITDLSNDPFSCYINETNVRYFVANTENFKPRFVKPGSILIAKSGNNLKPSIYAGESMALISPSVICLEINSEIILPRYFIYHLHQQYFKTQVEAIRNGVTVLSFRTEDFLKLVIQVTTLSEQEEFLKKNEAVRTQSGFTKDEIETLIGELKHKSKGPLGGIKASLTRLQNYVNRKQKSGEPIYPDDLAYNLLPNQKKDDFLAYSLEQTFKSLNLHVERVDDYLKKSVQFAMLGDDEIQTEKINLHELVNSILIPGNNYDLKILLNKKKSDRHITVQANRDKLLSVFELLIDNAFVHGFHSRPDNNSMIMISWEAKRGESLTQREVIITIENNGAPPKGITLEKFITKGHTTNKENGGMGLGGPFIHKALQLMGGMLVSVEDISEKTGELNAQFKFKLISDE